MGRHLWGTWRVVALLGLATIGAYGLLLYSFGSLLGPIADDTGWPSTGITAAFSLAAAATAVGAAIAGRLLDRFGARPVLLASLALGSPLLWAAAGARTLPTFIAGWGVGAGMISSAYYYNFSMAVTARHYPQGRERAFAILTFLGGLAGPIYFPLSGLLSETWGWRSTLRTLIVVLVATTLPAALLVQGGASPEPHHDAPAEGFASVRQALRSRVVWRLLAIVALGFLTIVALNVHQVKAMQSAGLALGLAGALAGARGFVSLPGRILLPLVVRRFGTAGGLRIVYVAQSLSCLALLAAIVTPWAMPGALVFAVVGGLAFGMIAPLQGLYSAEVFGDARIGTLMGLQQTVASGAAALGPLMVGFIYDATEGYAAPLVLMAVLVAVAVVILAPAKPTAGPPLDSNLRPAAP